MDCCLLTSHATLSCRWLLTTFRKNESPLSSNTEGFTVSRCRRSRDILSSFKLLSALSYSRKYTTGFIPLRLQMSVAIRFVVLAWKIRVILQKVLRKESFLFHLGCLCMFMSCDFFMLGVSGSVSFDEVRMEYCMRERVWATYRLIELALNILL